jgi:hypothetical protein
VREREKEGERKKENEREREEEKKREWERERGRERVTGALAPFIFLVITCLLKFFIDEIMDNVCIMKWNKNIEYKKTDLLWRVP